MTDSPPRLSDNKGLRPSGPSASSALGETFNNHNSLPAQDLPTVGADADANTDATGVGQPSTVRSKPLEPLALDAADGVDANRPDLSEQMGESLVGQAHHLK